VGAYEFDIGIIGGGAGGLTVAAGAAQLGAKTLLIEKEKNLGGDCLHYGCVPSKTLIRSARLYHQMKHAERFGLPPTAIPPVDFQQIVQHIRAVIATIQTHDSEERFCRLGVRVEWGLPTFIDDHAVRLNGKTYAAKTWVLATGSSPAIPPIVGLDATPFITNRELFYLDHLPKSMIILGAGPIGCEMAQSFCRLGSEIHVIDLAPQILIKEDRDMADALMETLRAEGVTFHLGATIERVVDHGYYREVNIINSAGTPLTLGAETILVALGRTANTAGLGLEQIGVIVDRRGIGVDPRLRTRPKNNYAIGDVNGGFQFTHAAGYEGGIVISNALFHLPRRADFTYLPWCTYTDPSLGSIGMNEKLARQAGIRYSLWTEEFKNNDRSLADGEPTGKIKMLLDEREKLIGIQILGANAGDLLGEWAAVLNGKVKLATLAAAVHPYPTVAEINKRIAGSYLSPRLFSEKVRKGLRLLFQLKGRACDVER
jgi:pyruvate/2-oxoglutarate dehydrogenase complex dihydrolipoamide dehydrogenase (E3) component